MSWQYLHHSHPDHTAVAEVENKDENHRVQDRKPVQVVRTVLIDLGGVEVQQAGTVPTVLLPLLQLEGDAHHAESDGAAQGGDEQHDPPGAPADHHQREDVGGKESAAKEYVCCELVNVCHSVEHGGGVGQHQVDSAGLEEEHQGECDDERLQHLTLEKLSG